MFNSENVYDISNIRVSGKVCLTNFPSNTAFRGFGGPQGMLIAENWIQHMATELKRNPEEIRVSMHTFVDGSSLVTPLSVNWYTVYRNLISTMREVSFIMASCSRIAQYVRFGMN